MPQRSRSHVLEDESRRAFEAAISPQFKFYERPQPEYGIDGDVEEFSETGEATSLHFFVQIKATDAVDLGNALSESVAIETANYWRRAPMPVLMVRYMAATDELYCRWFHQYDPYEGRGGRKSLTFRWQTGDIWNDKSAQALASDARAFYDLQAAALTLPRPFHLKSDGAFGRSVSELTIALRRVATERADILDLQPGPPPPGALSIQITDEEIRADLAKVTAAVLHLDAPHTALTANQAAHNGLALLALAFERVGQDSIASRLAASYFENSILVAKVDAAGALAWCMARAHRITEALQLSDRLDEPGNTEREEAAVIFGLPALYAANSLTTPELAMHEKTLRARATRRKRSDPVGAGRAYMNLANFHRARGRWDKANSYYELALKLDPEYASRAHYWYERGGALWGTNQFAKAAEAYQRAIDHGVDAPLAPALLADSMMYAGEYAAALELFVTYNAEHPEDDGEYRLKALALRAIVERLGISEQDRRTKQALEAARGNEPDDPEGLARQSEAQLARDALWGSAWLNLGLSDQTHERWAEALQCFVAGTILIVWDFEIWANAIIAAFGLAEADVLTDLVVSGRRMAGDEMISSVIEVAKRDTNDVPAEALTGVINEILGKHPRETTRAFAVRLLKAGGVVEEVVVEDPPERQGQ